MRIKTLGSFLIMTLALLLAGQTSFAACGTDLVAASSPELGSEIFSQVLTELASILVQYESASESDASREVIGKILNEKFEEFRKVLESEPTMLALMESDLTHEEFEQRLSQRAVELLEPHKEIAKGIIAAPRLRDLKEAQELYQQAKSEAAALKLEQDTLLKQLEDKVWTNARLDVETKETKRLWDFNDGVLARVARELKERPITRGDRKRLKKEKTEALSAKKEQQEKFVALELKVQINRMELVKGRIKADEINAKYLVALLALREPARAVEVLSAP